LPIYAGHLRTARWRTTAVVWRLALVAFVFGLAVINATGAFAQLVSAHMGERCAATSAIEAQDATLAARIDVQAHRSPISTVALARSTWRLKKRPSVAGPTPPCPPWKVRGGPAGRLLIAKPRGQ
jgi:hypothetical protein